MSSIHNHSDSYHTGPGTIGMNESSSKNLTSDAQAMTGWSSRLLLEKGDSQARPSVPLWRRLRHKLASLLQIPSAWDHDISVGISSTARAYIPSRQLRRLLIQGLYDWSITTIFCLALFAVLLGFEQRHILNSHEKHAFNVLQNLFIVCIGLAVGAALAGYSKIISWRFLAAKYRSVLDFDLVMNLDSKTNVLTLLWKGRTPGSWRLNHTQLLCIASLVITVGLELAGVLLGLVFEIQTATDRFDRAYGQVSIVQLDPIYDTHSDPVPSINAQRGIANIYGLMGQNFAVSYTGPDTIQTLDETVYTVDNSTFYHRFANRCPVETPFVTEYSNRTVSTTATCQELSIISGGYISNRHLTWLDPAGAQQTLYIPGMAIGTTTYMATNETVCGPRCARIMVLNTGEERTNPQQTITPQLFQCDSMVSPVSNTTTYPDPSKYQIPDIQAHIISGSIGWSGNFNSSTPWQFVTYTHNSYWSWDSKPKTAQDIAINIMYFAIDTIAAMDDSGPRILVEGWYPKVAEILSVDWHHAIPILVLIPSIQLIVLIGCLIFSRGIIIRDPGTFATARFLYPVVEKLHGKGSILNGDEIVDVLGDDVRLIYGVGDGDGVGDSDDPVNGGHGTKPDHEKSWTAGVVLRNGNDTNTVSPVWSPGTEFPAGVYV